MTGLASIVIAGAVAAVGVVVADDSSVASVAPASAETMAGADRQAQFRARLHVVNVPVGQRAGGSSARVHPATVQLTPVRSGRVVQVQRKAPGGWRNVARARQRSAVVELFVPLVEPGRTQRYRAVALDRRGSGRTVSPTFRVRTPGATFADDFNGPSLNRSKWGFRSQGYGGSRLCAKPGAARTRQGGGALTLSVRKVKQGRWRNGRNECPNGVWRNGSISTARAADPHLQKYGTVAARIRFQGSRGMHGAFWLQGPPRTGAEIDVVEHYGVGAYTPMTMKVHHTRYRNGQPQLRTATRDELLPTLRGRSATQWNVYAVTWTPKGYVFRVNGRVVWRTDKPHVSTERQEIILSLLTSDYATGLINAPRSTMKVDWVRAWRR